MTIMASKMVKAIATTIAAGTAKAIAVTAITAVKLNGLAANGQITIIKAHQPPTRMEGAVQTGVARLAMVRIEEVKATVAFGTAANNKKPSPGVNPTEDLVHKSSCLQMHHGENAQTDR